MLQHVQRLFTFCNVRLANLSKFVGNAVLHSSAHHSRTKNGHSSGPASADSSHWLQVLPFIFRLYEGALLYYLLPGCQNLWSLSINRLRPVASLLLWYTKVTHLSLYCETPLPVKSMVCVCEGFLAKRVCGFWEIYSREIVVNGFKMSFSAALKKCVKVVVNVFWPA